MASDASDKAISPLETPVDLDPSFTRADLLLEFTHLRNWAWDKAEQAATALVSKPPSDPVPPNLLGAALAGQGKPAEARAQYKLALQANPNYLNAQFNLGVLDDREGKAEAAITRCRATLQQDPFHEQATMGLARLLGATGKLDAAFAILEGL